MLLNTESSQHLVTAITYPIIAEFYPHELPLYLILRDTFFANPENFLHSRLVEDALLKHGADEIGATFSYVVFPMVSKILSYLTVEIQKLMQEECSEKAMHWLQSLFNAEEVPQPLITQTELRQIELSIDKIVNEETRKLSAEKRQARILKNAVMVKLAMATKA